MVGRLLLITMIFENSLLKRYYYFLFSLPQITGFFVTGKNYFCFKDKEESIRKGQGIRSMSCRGSGNQALKRRQRTSFVMTEIPLIFFLSRSAVFQDVLADLDALLSSVERKSTS